MTMHIPTSHRRWPLAAAAFLIGVAGVSPAAHATLQFYDGFAYDAGDLNGDGPPADAPAGQTAWSVSTGNTQVTTGSLTYPGVAATGNKATLAGVVNNNGDISVAGMTPAGGGSGTEWVGFLLNEASGGAAPGGFAVVGLNGNGTTGPSFGMLFNQNVYGIDNNAASADRGASATAVTGATTLFVAELDFSAGEIYLYLNPALSGQPDPASAAASLAMTASFQADGFDGVNVAAGFNAATFDIDAISVGTTFADVVPEPSTWAMTAAGGAGGLLAWRKRRARNVPARGAR